MKVSFRWLRELLPGLELSPQELAERLTLAGLAVDGLKTRGEGLDGVVAAKVVALRPHPSRDKLRLVTVDAGTQTLEIVCGAPNVPEPGGKVALARLGARLPGLGGVPLEARAIGGIASAGMLCSLEELGLGDASAGLWVLEPLAEPGRPLVEVYPFLLDTIFDLDITPNRADALGHVGIARDLAALLELELVLPEAPAPAHHTSEELSELVSISNRDFERCPEYGAALALDVQVGPSPAWLAFRLESLGIRSISNVVDITNLLLLEYGQPMHAFDLDRIRGGSISVRRASLGEPLRTLDGADRSLDTDDLVIADAEGPVALAGVMGGAGTEISSGSRRVLLECAHFQPRGVRRSARRHGLHTESSHRFERGTDRAAIEPVLRRALGLLSQLAGARCGARMLRLEAAPFEPTGMKLRSSRLDQLLGTEVPFPEALATLKRLGFSIHSIVEGPSGKEAQILSASHRHDVAIEADLIDEVARIRGLDALPTTLPAIVPQAPGQAGRLERRTAEVAATLGLSEALTYAFVSRRELELVRAPEPVVVLKNPLSEERSVLRTSLLPGLLEALLRARRRGEASLRLFAVGSCFFEPTNGPGSPLSQLRRPRHTEDAGLLPEERPSFAAILAGPHPEYLKQAPREHDLYDAKGVALAVVERLTGLIPDVLSPEPESLPHLHPRASALLELSGQRLGSFGRLHPDISEALEVSGSVWLVELDLAQVEAIPLAPSRYRPIPRLPAVTRDLSLVVPEATFAGNVQAVLEAAAGELCESIELVGQFAGGSVPDAHKSLTYRLVYRDPKAKTAPEAARTLTDREVDAALHAVVQAAGTKLGATLRA